MHSRHIFVWIVRNMLKSKVWNKFFNTSRKFFFFYGAVLLHSLACCKECFFFFSFFCLRSFLGGPVSPLLRFYCILHYSSHFNTWMVTHPSANHGPSCLTSVILRELVFPTWYIRTVSVFVRNRYAYFYNIHFIGFFFIKSAWWIKKHIYCRWQSDISGSKIFIFILILLLLF